MAFRTFAFAAFAALAAGCATLAASAADPDVLWKIVHGACVPHMQEGGGPAPCEAADLAGGYAVLKDIRGDTHYLLIPTARITGIEDPALLLPATPNFFAKAWRARGYTERAAGGPLPRDAISLAINSPFGRSQNQLHIHIECIRPDVREALLRQQNLIGDRWAPLPEKLSGHRYWAMRVFGEELGPADPFALLAAGRPGAGAHMDQQTLVVVGASFADGQPGFLLLSHERSLPAGGRAHGEELQDHSCTLAHPI